MPKLKQLCLYFTLISMVELTACMTLEQTPLAIPVEDDALERFAAQQKDDIAGGILPNGILTPQLLYRILEGDIAAQRGEGEKSVIEWMSLAKETNDARAAKHATLVAINAKNFAAAEEAAGLWITLAPESRSARQLMIGVLLQNKKISQIIPHVQMLLHSKPTEAAAFFAQLHLLWGQQFNVDEVVKTTESLTKEYLQLPEAKFALAYIKQITGQHEEAIQLLETALKQKPDLEVAKNLRNAIIANPTLGVQTTITLTYEEALLKANTLVQAGEYADAQQIYEKLLQASPNNMTVIYNYGLLAWQQGDMGAAVARLSTVEASQPPYVDEVRLYLGRIAEQRGDCKTAQKWYKQVHGAFQAEAQRARIFCLVKDKQLSTALILWKTMPKDTVEQKIQSAQLHAQIYVINKTFDKALTILTQALTSFPDSADLYYDRALTFEHSQQLDQAEADLRQALRLIPDNPIILNGLGFILVKHGKNLTEAEQILSRARELAPNNLNIEDSWAWLLYRQGKVAEAEKILRQLFLVYKEPDVIAHLVEVLWAQKKQQEAQQVLNAGNLLYPNNALLLMTSQRLGLR